MSTRKDKGLTRRSFLVETILAAAGILLSRCKYLLSEQSDALAQEVTPTYSNYLPFVSRDQPTPTPSPVPTSTPGPVDNSVIHVRAPNATNWSGSGWYGNAVNQNVVDSMVQTGLQQLTGQSAWGDIWYSLFSSVQSSGYQAGQQIAVKVNFNNSSGCNDSDDTIDALPQPVSALIAGLKQAGVREQDIWIYDATKTGRYIPDRFRTPILSRHPNVRFCGRGACQGVIAASHGKDPSLTVRFQDPGNDLTDRQLADLLYDATYLINMPILKRHSGDQFIPVSLGFKNHLGSLNNILRGGNDSLHKYLGASEDLYRSTYSPLIDIYSNPNVNNKTVLTLGEGLYGSNGATGGAIVTWSIFGDALNSLFFATDPVAIDCVMVDFLAAEGRISQPGPAYDYLFCAQEAGLGLCEGTRSNPGGDPLGSGYSEIQYRRFDL